MRVGHNETSRPRSSARHENIPIVPEIQRLKGKYNGKKGETAVPTKHCDVIKLPS